MQKIIFFLTPFLKYYKDITNCLDTLGTPGHVHHKQQHRLLGNSDVYLQTKNQRGSSIFLEILHFKESNNPNGQDHFGQWLLQNMNFDMENGVYNGEAKNQKNFNFALLLGKINDKTLHSLYHIKYIERIKINKESLFVTIKISLQNFS